MTGRRRAAAAPTPTGAVRAVAFALALMALSNIATLAAVHSWVADVAPAGWLLVAALGQCAAGSAATVAWVWSR